MKFGPALRAAAGIAVLSIMDAFIKGMSAYYPTLQVALLRFACGSLVVAGVVAVLRPGWPSRETVTANSLRSVIAVVTAVSFFYALGQLPLAETLVLSFLSPMFIALFGMLLLREKVDARIVGAIAIGFAGTLVVVLGQTEEAGAARSWIGRRRGSALRDHLCVQPRPAASARPARQVPAHRHLPEFRALRSWSRPSGSGSGNLSNYAHLDLVPAHGRPRGDRPYAHGDRLCQGRGGAARPARIHRPDLGGR